MMDAETVQLLQELPNDPRERGWLLVVAESEVRRCGRRIPIPSDLQSLRGLSGDDT